MTEMLTVGSLFAGIGGIELGLEWTGVFRTVWQVERDEYCRRVLAKHWPDAVRYEDVCSVGSANLTPVDVICGGFPCQDISNAGKRVGIDGERSGLWREYARIVRELRPRYVLVENVAALLGRGLDVVLGDLAACGYDAEWSVLSAQNVGAPHLRERLFVVAYPASDRVEKQRLPAERRQLVADALRSGRFRENAAVSNAERTGRQGRTGSGHDGAGRQTGIVARGSEDISHTDREPMGRTPEPRSERGHWLPERDVGRVAHGVPARVDRLRALGNAVVPQCAELVGHRILDMERERLSDVA